MYKDLQGLYTAIHVLLCSLNILSDDILVAVDIAACLVSHVGRSVLVAE